MHNLILYGGTFDPVHNGHIQTAINIQNHFHFERFLFLPCKTPVLKHNALASSSQRIRMLELALTDLKTYNFEIDLSEINRDTPSYMVDSLAHFRQQWGNTIPITLLMGADTFHSLPKWHNWQCLLTLANIMVIKRAGFSSEAPQALQELLIKHETFSHEALLSKSQGWIYQYDAGFFDISSTWIRENRGKPNLLKAILPSAVLDYIKQYDLYR